MLQFVMAFHFGLHVLDGLRVFFLVLWYFSCFMVFFLVLSFLCSSRSFEVLASLMIFLLLIMLLTSNPLMFVLVQGGQGGYLISYMTLEHPICTGFIVSTTRQI